MDQNTFSKLGIICANLYSNPAIFKVFAMATRILMEWNYLSNSERGLPKDPYFEVSWHSTK